MQCASTLQLPLSERLRTGECWSRGIVQNSETVLHILYFMFFVFCFARIARNHIWFYVTSVPILFLVDGNFWCLLSIAKKGCFFCFLQCPVVSKKDTSPKDASTPSLSFSSLSSQSDFSDSHAQAVRSVERQARAARRSSRSKQTKSSKPHTRTATTIDNLLAKTGSTG